MAVDDALPKVAILLCTYHGQHYLAAQLDSIATQSYQHWQVWASDDGSRDDTHGILEAYRVKWGDARLSIHAGPAAGFKANFLSLTCNASIAARCYAYSDQDDIWETDKLQRAMDWLLAIPAGVPALYCARTRLVDAQNRDIGMSPLFSRAPGFANALMQNVGGGNTMVFNDAARALLREAGPDVDVVSHDSWVYIVVSGCGGRVMYDPQPSLRYRQHDANVVGNNTGWRARLDRMRKLWQGNFRHWNERHIVELQRIRHRLTPANRETLDRLTEARTRALLPRLWMLKKSGVYRQTLLGNMALFAAAIFKKI